MKILYKISYLLLISLSIFSFFGCEKVITDFGNDCEIFGRLIDQTNNIVAGDITSTNLMVRALGEGDIITTDMRVDGDGTFQHTKLYPKKYKIWVTGPVTQMSDTLQVDFSIDKIFEQDITVLPYITIKNPIVVGNPTSTSVEVNYEILENEGQTVSKRQLYCSTNPYPTASMGSGPFYMTKTVNLSNNSGTSSVTGLKSKTKYYVRIGAQATGASGFNFSSQIEITTL